jgi:hypothetical protein
MNVTEIIEIQKYQFVNKLALSKNLSWGSTSNIITSLRPNQAIPGLGS